MLQNGFHSIVLYDFEEMSARLITLNLNDLKVHTIIDTCKTCGLNTCTNLRAIQLIATIFKEH